ncbi:uncharacterized protein LOC125945439 [Dermacentor silvarum]|uniref:uncharacterized protein LOC125945439 n=1 Tax=Dermacentor silvarum TaxID=543639 RepID=UPI0021009264|nr:uncharacterized protein LOC125945439 [Dermacentor silvarum]
MHPNVSPQPASGAGTPAESAKSGVASQDKKGDGGGGQEEKKSSPLITEEPKQGGDQAGEGKEGKGFMETLMGFNPLAYVRRQKVERRDSLEVLRKRRMNKEDTAEPFPLQQCLAFGLTAILVIILVIYVVVGSSSTAISSSSTPVDKEPPNDPDNDTEDIVEDLMGPPAQAVADDARERDLVFLLADWNTTTAKTATLAVKDTAADELNDVDDEGVSDDTGRTTS